VLKHNAAAVILVHNHPSGEPEPSRCDIQLTKKLQELLEMLDVRLLDHFIVAGLKRCRWLSGGWCDAESYLV
jgi:DNA repair protein RadC